LPHALPTANWNQYLGPDRNATISGTEILRSWSDKGPKELWSIPLGEGYGGAAIFGNEVFVLDRKKGESDIMRCHNLKTGKEIWSYTYEQKVKFHFLAQGLFQLLMRRYIWSVGPHGDFYCFSRRDPKTSMEPQFTGRF
jgi:outer membrane protein assembly factor BamB